MESHLLQMRGLKRLPLTLDARTLKSHLLQMRGLKLLLKIQMRLPEGRIFYRCVD